MAEMVGHGETVADIGTDHGYVPMLLFKNGVSPKVIMSDISDGSLAKAKETFEQCRLDIPECDFRTGDGLDTIEIGEVDVIIIGGLGGHTIVDILDADIVKTRSFKRLILQPRKHSGALRHYLYTHGFDITDELLIREGKFECEIIVSVPTNQTEREELYSSDDIRWKYPILMAETNSELAADRIGWKLGSIKEQIKNLKSSKEDKRDLITLLEKDSEYLNGILSEINNSHNNH